MTRYAGACLEIFDDQSLYGDRDGWVVRSALVDHHPVAPAVGYRIERAGHVVTVSGDTTVCAGIRQLAEGADVLVHEALLTASVSTIPTECGVEQRPLTSRARTARPISGVVAGMVRVVAGVGVADNRFR